MLIKLVLLHVADRHPHAQVWTTILSGTIRLLEFTPSSYWACQNPRIPQFVRISNPCILPRASMHSKERPVLRMASFTP